MVCGIFKAVENPAAMWLPRGGLGYTAMGSAVLLLVLLKCLIVLDGSVKFELSLDFVEDINYTMYKILLRKMS